MLRFLRRLSCVLTLGIAPIAMAASNYAQGGYGDRLSVPQGVTIAFHIASSIAPLSVELVNGRW